MYDTIVVGTDGSASAAEAVSRAADLAVHHKGGLVIVSAFHPEPEVTERVEEVLARTERACKDRGVSHVQSRAVPTGAAQALLEVAENVDADLIVVGTARRFHLASVPIRVAHHAGCDVVIVRPSGGHDRDRPAHRP